MKSPSPRNLAFLAAAVLTGVVVVTAAVIFLLLSAAVSLVFLGTLAAACFIAAWLLFRYTIEHFLHNRIKLIYKTIHTEKSKKGEGWEKKRKGIMKRDILGDAGKEVEEWAAVQRQEIARLREMETYRKEFLGNVSHELKTPVFNIQGYVLTLLEGGLEDPSINRNYLRRMEKSVERMINIVQDLEVITQLESGKLHLDMDSFDVIELTKEVFESQEIHARQKNIRLVFREKNQKPVSVAGDKDRIRQVMTNLVVNSIRYGRPDGTTEVRFYDMDENILTEVSDSGIGIAQEHLPRIFERFYRVDKSRSREHGGTGLGLSIVKHIIEAHGQTINVRSTEGVGSTFSFTLKKG